MRSMLILLFCVSVILVLNGCSNNSSGSPVTEKDAKQMVLDHHERKAGKMEIKSIFKKDDKYIIEWEIEPIESGMDSVHIETGEIKVIESSHGTCKWF